VLPPRHDAETSESRCFATMARAGRHASHPPPTTPPPRGRCPVGRPDAECPPHWCRSRPDWWSWCAPWRVRPGTNVDLEAHRRCLPTIPPGRPSTQCSRLRPGSSGPCPGVGAILGEAGRPGRNNGRGAGSDARSGGAPVTAAPRPRASGGVLPFGAAGGMRVAGSACEEPASRAGTAKGVRTAEQRLVRCRRRCAARPRQGWAARGSRRTRAGSTRAAGTGPTRADRGCGPGRGRLHVFCGQLAGCGQTTAPPPG